jgi:hemerythrin superfamily protein
MGTMIATGTDVVSFLQEQHQQIKTMFASVNSASGDERAKAFSALRRMLAVHETAEEEIVHPAARRALPDGEAIVSARLREENEAKKVLAELEKLNVDSTEFDSKFRALEKAVIAHADAEEREEFSRLGAELEPARLERMRKAVEFAEKVAPTRPHPGVESAAANLLVGPFASMIDRARDAIAGKS